MFLLSGFYCTVILVYELLNNKSPGCPFGVHVLGLMQYDALGAVAAQKLDYDRGLTFGIGLLSS